MKLVHIVGCPRSGTTLLMEMMATCFEHDWHCAHEISLLKPLPIKRGISLTKRPDDIFFLPQLISNTKNIFFIYVVRDPRAVFTSMHSKHPGNYFVPYSLWKKSHEIAVGLKDSPKLLEITYETLVSDPDTVQQQIMAAQPFLKKRHLFSEYHLYAQSSSDSKAALNNVRATDKSRITGWQQHLPRVKQQVILHPTLLKDLIRFGYEPNQEWASCLDAVTPLNKPQTHNKPNKPLGKRFEKWIRGKIRLRSALRRLAKAGL